VWATAVQLQPARAVPIGPAPGNGRADVGALQRKAGVLPIGEPADVAADVAVAVGGQGGRGGAGVAAIMVVGVEDDLGGVSRAV
jgi:hypothetical protein